MKAVVEPVAARRGLRMLATLTDEELLARVAEMRDREAFQQLFERYAKPAFNLARYLARDDARAEDAVQESMLRVWLKAGQFDPARGSARAWILRVVANKTLAAKRNLRDEKGQAMIELDDAAHVGEARAPVQAEERELATALRAKMNDLPASLRQVMVLYYVCEMKQSEIAETLAMPQTTVSLRIREGLAELRNRLEVAGFAAAVPMLGNEKIGAVLLDGREAPRGLAEKILSNLDRAAAHSARVLAAGGYGVLLWTCAVLVLAATGGGWWLLQQVPPAKPVNTTMTEKTVAPEKADNKAPRTGWDFNTAGDAADLGLVKDSQWHWVADGGPDGSGCMETDTFKFLAKLPVPADKAPFLFTICTKPLDPDAKGGALSSINVLSYRDKLAMFKNAGTPHLQDADNVAWVTAKIFVSNAAVDCWIGGHRTSIIALEMEEGTKLALTFRGRHLIDYLKVQKISEADLPDQKPFFDALERLAPGERKGTLVLPEIKSPQSGKQVTVTFYGRDGVLVE